MDFNPIWFAAAASVGAFLLSCWTAFSGSSRRSTDIAIQLALDKFRKEFQIERQEALSLSLTVALSVFQEKLDKEGLLVNKEVVEYRFRGEDDKIKDLDHRLRRNSEHTSMIIACLLDGGIMKMKQQKPTDMMG